MFFSNLYFFTLQVSPREFEKYFLTLMGNGSSIIQILKVFSLFLLKKCSFKMLLKSPMILQSASMAWLCPISFTYGLKCSQCPEKFFLSLPMWVSFERKIACWLWNFSILFTLYMFQWRKTIFYKFINWSNLENFFAILFSKWALLQVWFIFRKIWTVMMQNFEIYNGWIIFLWSGNFMNRIQGRSIFCMLET